MSGVYILTPDEDGQRPGTTQSTRSRLHKAALKYAERGIPVFPCMPGDKRPAVKKCPEAARKQLVGEALAEHARTCLRDGHGFHDATTDPRKINDWWGRYKGANIGMPTGERSGIISQDLDTYKPGAMTVEEVEAKLGAIPETATVRTGRGGLQFLYRCPEGEALKSIPEDQLGKGVCIKAEGGYIILPPSRTEGPYEVLERRPLADVPEWLLEQARERDRAEAPRPRRSSLRRERRKKAVPGEPIPEGKRNSDLFFVALDLKDAGMSADEVLDELLATNEARCTPPLDTGEVEKIAKSAARYPIRSGDPTPELIEAVERLEASWWARPWPGMGGKTDRDVYRVLIELARRYGRLQKDGSVEVSASVRGVALAAATNYVTISRGATKRLARDGLVVKLDNGRGRTEAATWRLLAISAQGANTQHLGACRNEMSCVSTLRAWELETPAFRWTGHVKKGRAGVLYLLEGYGPLTEERIAELLGCRLRDLRRRGYVSGLVGLGLVEERDDGTFGLYEDHMQRVEEVRSEPIPRKRISVDPVGRRVAWTEDTPSEIEREQTLAAKYEEQNRKWRERNSPEAEKGIRELLNRWDEERGQEPEDTIEPEQEVPKNLADPVEELRRAGWVPDSRLGDDLWAHPSTGEVAGRDAALAAARKEAS